MTVGQQLIIAAIPGFPALTFLILALFGRYLKENAQFIAIIGLVFSLVFSSFSLAAVAGVTGEVGPIDFAVNWIDLGEGGSFQMGVYIDGLAAVMLVVVCFVSLMIQLYSGEFMRDDPRFAWYYAVLNLFTASMLGLVLAPNFIELYVFWELVGLCSYLLIGHWFEKPSARDAAQKAFIVTRIGDAALFVGIIIFWRATGTTSFEGISEAAQAGFIGSSLLTAGVYLVARTYDIFVQSESAMLVVAYIGGFTALMAATMALVKKDIKRVIAYSTVSQLGYMMLGLGIGSYTAGIFHLYNHAFFKALLFLCAGSIIYAMDSYNLFEMGGLRRRMPITFWAMVIAGLSLSGIFPLSGFWSKDSIVASAYDEHYYVLFGMALLTVFLTAFYIFRAIFLAFTGEPRTEGARGAVESPGIMTGPMMILAFLSIVSGWVGIPEGSGIPIKDYFAEFVVPSEFARETLGIEPHPFSLLMAAISVAAALLGIGLAYALYVSRPERAGALSRRFSGLYTFLDKGWYFDALYGATFVRAAKFLGRLARGFDREVLVGGLTGGVGRGVSGFGELLRRLQTGGVQNYALFILLSVLVIGVIVGAQYAFLVFAFIVLATITAFAVGSRL